MTVQELRNKLELLMEEGFSDHRVTVSIGSPEEGGRGSTLLFEPSDHWADGMRKTVEMEIF